MATDFGIIGLGNIGYGIASNLRKKIPSSATLYVCDVSEAASKRLIDEYGKYGNIEVVSSPKDLVSKCGTVFSSLPSEKSVRQVYLDTGTGVIDATKDENRLLIECSTIDIESTQEIGKTILDPGLGTFVDATVSGGVWGANEGKLSFMVGYKDPGEGDAMAKRVLETLSLVGQEDKI